MLAFGRTLIYVDEIEIEIEMLCGWGVKAGWLIPYV